MEYKGCDINNAIDNAGAWGEGKASSSPPYSEHPEDNFYILKSDGLGCGNHRYKTRSEAVAKAEKIAADQPGARIYLMKVETSCIVEKSPARWRRP